MNKLAQYKSLVVALAGAVLVGAHSALNGDNHVNVEETVQLGIAAFTAAQVWLTANVPGSRHAKAATAGVLAVLNVLVSHLTGGIDHAEVVNLVIVGLTAAGVLVLPNAPKVPEPVNVFRD